MEDIQNNENSGVDTTVQSTQNEQPFRVFKTQKEFDDFSAHLIKKTEEKTLKNAKVEDDGVTFNAKEYEAKYRKDLEAKIRADIERQAKMTEAEKLAEERKAMEQSFREERIELNKEIAKNLLSKAGFEEDEMDVYLDFVTEDKDTSMGRIMRVCESRKSAQEKLKSKWQEELQKNNPNLNIGSNEVNSLQAEYDKAKKEGNYALMSACLRTAQQKNIKIQ